MRKISSNPPHRIGIYIRVSTEEQASNPEGSIKSQEQRLRQHVSYQNQDQAFGEIAHVFIDRGKSGKDIEHRPELKRLLHCIEAGQITMVLVTELSRLSRSIQDFCQIWELMRRHGCGFQSLREQFDTTTAAGEMVLYTIANIAQFERKQTSERIKANFLARAERGLFNGGSVPLGFALDPERKGYLKVHPDEAIIVREAFNTFLREGSLSLTGKSLNERGIRLPRKRVCGGDKPRLGHFTVDNLYQILTNPAYIGQRAYEKKGENRLSRACWEPIVEESIFQAVASKLKSNKSRCKLGRKNRYPFLLSGLVFCGTCQDRLPGKSAHGNGGKIPYYEHGWAVKRQAMLNEKIFRCEPHRVNGKRLEEVIWSDVLEVLSDPVLGRRLVDEAKRLYESGETRQEIEKLELKIQAYADQIEALAAHLATIPKGLSPAPIFTHMQKMEQLTAEAQKEYDRRLSEQGVQELPASWTNFESFLKSLRTSLPVISTPELRSKIIGLLVHKVEVFPDRVWLHYFVGESRIRELKQPSNAELPVFDGFEARGVVGMTNPNPAEQKEKPGLKFLSNPGSNNLIYGRGERIRTSDPLLPKQMR
jgi:site-specific DNA recombinase